MVVYLGFVYLICIRFIYLNIQLLCMASRNPQNGYGVFKQNLDTLRHFKRNTHRHSKDDYVDMGDRLGDE